MILPQHTATPASAVGLALVLALSLTTTAGCSGDQGTDDVADGDDTDVPDDIDPDAPEPEQPDEWEQLLDTREIDYSAALRIAALRLTGQLPTLAEIKFVADADDQAQAYRALIESYLDDPRFGRQMMSFWQDTLKMGDTPMLDSAPAFAALVVAEDRPYTDLLTATTGTCATYDPGSMTAAPADCNNNVATHAGLLSHPGMNAHFVSNMAFRRVRWVQETFACTAFPAEVGEPTPVGETGVSYTAPWTFDSIAGAQNGGEIDFLDTASVVCANCHATMNHIAPLFSFFDDDGNFQDTISVVKPTEGLPFTLRTDWLPEGEATAWRHGFPADDLPGLGAAMAADPLIAECAVARVWNFAFGKGDIVDTLAVVPTTVISDQVTDFTANGYRLRQTFLDVFTSDDFIRF